jgi:hypothetical protein
MEILGNEISRVIQLNVKEASAEKGENPREKLFHPPSARQTKVLKRINVNLL